MTDATTDLSATLKALLESLARAEKTRADAEKTRAETEAARQKAAQEQQVASLDLDAKRLANDKARQDQQALVLDKTIERAKGLVPDLESMEKSTVTFGEGHALREGEAIKAALATAALHIAEAIQPALKSPLTEEPVIDPVILCVSSEPDLVAAMARYALLINEAQLLGKSVAAAVTASDALLESDFRNSPRSLGESLGAVSFVSAAITELASLTTLDVDVRTATTDLPTRGVHAAVIGAVLTTSPHVHVVHEKFRVPGADSPLLSELKKLIEGDLKLAPLALEMDSAVKLIGDPAKDLASAETALIAAKAEDNATAVAVAEEQRDHAREQILRLARVTEVASTTSTALAKTTAFVERITTTETGQRSLLAAALAIEPIHEAPDETFILSLEGTDAASNQLLIKRRIFAPRLQTSVSLTVDYFLVRGDSILAAGRAAGAVSLHGRITRRGAVWRSLADPLEPREDSSTG